MSSQSSGSEAASQGTPPQFQVRIPLEWESGDEVPILYANQVMVSHLGPEFFLVFGAVVPPPQSDQLPDSLRIHPQVRIAIAREAMPAIVQALNDSLTRFRAADAQRRNAGAGGTERPNAPSA